METWVRFFIILQHLHLDRSIYLFVVLQQQMPNLLELGVILQRQWLNEPNIDRFQRKQLISLFLCINGVINVIPMQVLSLFVKKLLVNVCKIDKKKIYWLISRVRSWFCRGVTLVYNSANCGCYWLVSSFVWRGRERRPIYNEERL